MKKVSIKNIYLCMLAVSMSATSFAQKKLAPVNQSLSTGISLPAGSKQDTRVLSVAAAKMLLETESKDANIKLSATEVLLLPSANSSGFNSDSLSAHLSLKGWSPTAGGADKKYSWLKKDDQYILMYCSMDAKKTELYFAKASSAPGKKNVSSTANSSPQNTPPNNQNGIGSPAAPSATNTGFAFSTSNFDDGWTSTVQEDWVSVQKGNLLALLHFPNAKADAYNSVVLDGLRNAWDVLVAPRYSSASNMAFRSSGGWESVEYGEADMIDNKTGKRFYVVLFKKNFSGGQGKYIEFISADKKTFEKEFGSYENGAANSGTGSGFDKMSNMVSYNKFAVAASDLKGKWTSNFTGMTQYVNAYTGASAGANTHASNENFEFGPGNTYKWDLGVASGFVGNIKFQSVKSAGKFNVPNNWQVSFSDIEGKPKTYNVQFTCIKGARVLWIGDTGFGRKE